MIQALSGWAVDNWPILESKAVVLGLIGRPGGPASPLDLEGRIFLAFIEGVLRESEHHSKKLDSLYSSAIPAKPTPKSKTSRRRDIDRAMRLFGG